MTNEECVEKIRQSVHEQELRMHKLELEVSRHPTTAVMYSALAVTIAAIVTIELTIIQMNLRPIEEAVFTLIEKKASIRELDSVNATYRKLFTKLSEDQAVLTHRLDLLTATSQPKPTDKD